MDIDANSHVMRCRGPRSAIRFSASGRNRLLGGREIAGGRAGQHAPLARLDRAPQMSRSRVGAGSGGA